MMDGHQFEIMLFIGSIVGLILIVLWFAKAKKWRDQEHYDQMKKMVKETMEEEAKRTALRAK